MIRAPACRNLERQSGVNQFQFTEQLWIPQQPHAVNRGLQVKERVRLADQEMICVGHSLQPLRQKDAHRNPGLAAPRAEVHASG